MPRTAKKRVSWIFFEAPDADAWRAWLSRWADAVVAAEGDAGDATEVVRRLREVNPKHFGARFGVISFIFRVIFIDFPCFF